MVFNVVGPLPLAVGVVSYLPGPISKSVFLLCVSVDRNLPVGLGTETFKAQRARLSKRPFARPSAVLQGTMSSKAMCAELARMRMLSSGDSISDSSFVSGDRNLPAPTQWCTRTRAYPDLGRVSAEGVPEFGCYVGGAFLTRSHFGSERRTSCQCLRRRPLQTS